MIAIVLKVAEFLKVRHALSIFYYFKFLVDNSELLNIV